jgi:hypothetical protein
MEKLTRISKAVYWTCGAIGAVVSPIVLFKFTHKRKSLVESILDCPEEVTDVKE